MREHDTELSTPAEAAVLSRLSLKAVNNAIDKKTVPVRRGRRADSNVRLAITVPVGQREVETGKS
jgi:hypothetical protein